jgi:replicative DNA helicase
MDLVRRADCPPSLEPLILSALATDPDLLPQVRVVVSGSTFADPVNRLIADQLLSLFDRYNRVPSLPVLEESVAESGHRSAYEAQERVRAFSPVRDVGYVRDRIAGFSQWRAIDAAFEDADGLNPEELAERIVQASRIGSSIGESFLTLNGDIGAEDLRRPTVVTPWPFINDLLRGGPEKGDLCAILSFINVGKTTLLVNVAVAAMAAGLNVVYFTFEDGERKIRRRFLQCITGMTVEQLVQDQDKAIRLRDRFLKKGGNASIKGLLVRQSTVRDAWNFVRAHQSRSGRPVDLVVTDYADRFRASTANREPRHEWRSIAEDCKAMAMDLDVVHWTASQVQRSRAGEEVVDLEHVAESMGKVEGADLVLGVGQRKDEVRTGRMVMTTAKVRDAEKGANVPLIANFEVQRVLEA